MHSGEEYVSVAVENPDQVYEKPGYTIGDAR